MIKNGCIKSKDGKIIMEEEELKRWAEYIGEMYSDSSRQEDFATYAELEGPPIMQSEVELNMERQQVRITFMHKSCQH